MVGAWSWCHHSAAAPHIQLANTSTLIFQKVVTSWTNLILKFKIDTSEFSRNLLFQTNIITSLKSDDTIDKQRI